MTRQELADSIKNGDCAVALYRDSHRRRFEDILLKGTIEDNLQRFDHFRNVNGNVLVLVLERDADHNLVTSL